MTTKAIRAWYACQNPGYRGAWDFILINRNAGEFYVFAFELQDIAESSPQTNFNAAWLAFLQSAGLEVETQDIPPFGEVEIVRIDTAYVDQVLAAINSPDYTDTCAVWGFNGAPYPV